MRARLRMRGPGGAGMSTAPETIYTMVNERILDALNRGVVPWRQPWKSSNPFAHRNAMTGHPYRGVNVFLLTLTRLAKEYASPRWLTFYQARELGGTVKRGEKGTPVIFWKVLEHAEEDANGQEVIVKTPMLKHYTVFNVDQTEGIREDRLVPTETPRNDEFQPVAEALRIAQEYSVGGPRIVHGSDRAFYSPIQDTVTLPSPTLFDSRETYYATLFHELAHSTGHKDRLDRATLRQMGHFGDRWYGQEELVAEIGGSFLQAHAGIECDFEMTAAYLDSWMKAIRADLKLLVVAAAQAQRAADWVLGERPTARGSIQQSPSATAAAQDA